MPTPRVTIDALPEQATPEDTNLIVIQDGTTTKKMTLATLATQPSAQLAAHLADTTEAHAASAISAADSGHGIDGTTVQGQLGQLATLAGSTADLVAANDVVWVGAEEPADPAVEMWWDTDAPSVYAPAVVEFADDAETIAGTLTDRAVTPAGLAYERPYVDVRSFGAVGDGVTDDSAAIQAAIDAATAGDTIVFPRGSYAVNTNLNITKSLTFQGHGAELLFGTSNTMQVNASNVTWIGVTFRNTSTVASLLLTKSTAGNFNRWIWQDCRFVNEALRITKIGRIQTDGSAAPTGSDLTGQCHIVGCEFTGYTADYTIEIGGQDDTIFERNWVHDYGTSPVLGEGLKVLARSTGTRIVDNTFEDGTRDGVDVYDSWRNTVTGNVFRNCGGNGLEVKWNAPDTGGPPVQNIVANNRAEACLSGFNLSADYITATGNIARGCTTFGFRVGPSIDVSATPTKHVTLVANQALSNTGDGFVVTGANRCSLVGNSAQANGTYGFNVSSAANTGVSVIGNTATGNTSSDINAGSIPADTVIIGNHFTTGLATFAALPNNTVMHGRLSTGAYFEMLKVTTGGQLTIGNAAASMALLGSLVTCFPKLSCVGEIEIDGALNHDGTTVGFYGAVPVVKAASPGTATGADAAVLNAVITALRNLGLVT